MEVTSTEVQNNFGAYLKLAQVEEIYITRNGKRIAVLKRWKETAGSITGIAETRGTYRSDRPRISVEEFEKLSSASENRYELIDGEVYQLASPSFEHQRIVLEIVNQIYRWSQGKKCKPITAPFDVTLMKDDASNIVQPDIVVICDPDNIDDQGRYTGTPTLIIEVLSETTRNRDMLTKLNLYMCGGVGEYWIADPHSREVYIYTFESDRIRNYRALRRTEIAHSEVLEDLSVRLEQVFY